jgi:hypothetical protein
MFFTCLEIAGVFTPKSFAMSVIGSQMLSPATFGFDPQRTILPLVDNNLPFWTRYTHLFALPSQPCGKIVNHP